MPLTVPSPYIQLLEKRLGFSLENPSRRQLDPIIRRVASLSETFIRQEGERDAYLDDPENRLAYLTYYTTVNLTKMFYPLGEIRRATDFFSGRTLRLLDVGSGTGSALLGCHLWYRERYGQSIETVAVDHAPYALQELKNDFAALFPESRLTVQDLDLRRDPLPKVAADIVTLSNVINELPDGGMELMVHLQSAVVPDGWVVVLEPALLRTSRGLLRFRDAAVESGWTVFAPCTRQSTCPALVKDTDWCHHELTWDRPEFIRIIDESLGMVKKTLKFSYLILSRIRRNVADEWPGDVRRMVSERFDEKGRTRFFLCGESGRHGYIRNRRDRMEANRVVDNLTRYDLVSCDNCMIRKNDVLIGKESSVRLLRGGSAIDE